MWNRKSVLFLCLLLWFVSPSIALCQSGQINPVKIYLTPDSTGVRVTSVPPSLHPAHIVPSRIDRGKNTSGDQPTQGSILAPTSDAQWVSLHVSGTQWDWRARKPGTYAGKVLVGSIQSNGEVLIDFWGFGKLENPNGADNALETYYAVAPPTARIDDLGWMDPDQLNAFDMRLNQSDPVSATWALWQRIVVGNSAPASEFEGKATISIKLQNLAPFVDLRPSMK